MQDIKINFLGENPEPSKNKLMLFLKIFGGIVLTSAVFAIIVSTAGVSENNILSQVPIIKQVNQLIHSADRKLDGESGDRINILLLGMGGARHDGPFLTDTIILASIKPKTGQVALISIPRDLSVPIPELGYYKANHINSYGESREAGSGGELSKQVLSDVLKTPINYYVRVDFSGFTKLIDNFGGVDIYVENSFVDNAYPTGENGNVRTISFNKGWEHMNGDRALEFARSRHGSNGEGSDFARARRQQKIIEAVKSKVFSLGTLRSPQKISSIIDSVKNNVKTDLSPWEILSLARLTSTLDTSKIITKVLEDGPDGLLTSTTGVDGAYLLVPKNYDWTPIFELVNNVFASESVPNKDPEKPLRVEIQNGTRVTGLAAQTAQAVRSEGFEVVKIGNAEKRDYTKTIIYDLTQGKETEALEKLKNKLNADISLTLPGWILNGEIVPQDLRLGEANTALAATMPNVDFLIILGN